MLARFSHIKSFVCQWLFLQTGLFCNLFQIKANDLLCALSCSLCNSIGIRYLIAIHFSCALCVFAHWAYWKCVSLGRNKYNNLWAFDANPYRRWHIYKENFGYLLNKFFRPKKKTFHFIWIRLIWVAIFNHFSNNKNEVGSNINVVLCRVCSRYFLV